MNISIKQAMELITSAEHFRIDHGNDGLSYELFSNVSGFAASIVATDTTTHEEYTYVVTAASIVDGRYIELVYGDDDDIANVYIFTLTPVTNLTA